jgi:hypothetical protein
MSTLVYHEKLILIVSIRYRPTSPNPATLNLAMTDVSTPFTVNSQPSDIETVYTTAAPQGESTDWLTAVRNLRQSNRKLLEQIEQLEIQLVELRSENSSYQERCRTQGLKIIQQDDDLQIARDRVSSLFEQLENSHQIGQRQQVLVETLSQKLEIAQTIVAEIEGENNQLKQEQADREQRLRKTEAVAQELYRRLKHQVESNATTETAATDSGIPKVQATDHEDYGESTLSGPLEFEVEPIRSAWPAPAVQAAAELKAKPHAPLELPKFGKK